MVIPPLGLPVNWLAIWGTCDVWSVISKIVRVRKPDANERSILVLEVKYSRPIVRPVFFEAAGSAGRGGTIIDVGIHSEVECVLSRVNRV